MSAGRIITPVQPSGNAAMPARIEAAIPSAAFATGVAGIDHPGQQRTGSILRILKTVVQHLHDEQAGVEPDHIGEF
jgi:hypothetical protein